MDSDQICAARVAYLVHDLGDAAVRRRIDLLAGEGIAVDVGGFRRRAEDRIDMRFANAIDLGGTRDGCLAQRAMAVLRHLFVSRAVRSLCDDTGLILARNLEMLVLGWRVRGPGQRLVYECLDIHRIMLGTGLVSRLMRWIERRMLAHTDLVIVSSPAFARHYFGARQGRTGRVLLVENKVPDERGTLPAVIRLPDHRAPYVIGWFGMLRCRRTLKQLLLLASQSAGRITVVIAGIPSPAEFGDFAEEISGHPGVRYLGPYRAEDIGRLYAEVDFVWAIDYFEEGLNSDWLLPNRLYEGLAHGVVPIALRNVETGRWLERNGVGLLIDDPLAQLPLRLNALKRREFDRMQAAIAGLAKDVLYQTPQERRVIVQAILGPPNG